MVRAVRTDWITGLIVALVLNTSGTIIGLLLNEVIEFDTFISLALYMLVFGGQIIGVAIMHFLQQKLKWEAKWLLFTCCTCIVIM